MTGADVLGQVLAPRPSPFALLHRPGEHGPDRLDVIVGEVTSPATLAEVRLDENATGHDVLVLVPYRQVGERGFARVDDGAPLLALRVTAQEEIGLAEAMARIPEVPVRTTGGHFDVPDDDYADTVRAVVDDEIGQGTGANFVLKRTWLSDITGYTVAHALAVFRRLCTHETGAHWTFVVHTGDRTFVGASPERHISLRAGVAVMNPISGTYRFPVTGSTLAGVLEFLHDVKERDELRMVVDEELKMMATVCDSGCRVDGPYLKEMARLAHTEYLIEGRATLDPREILRRTLFAPTVTGSPLESACRVIARYEPAGRGYYSGVVALLGRDGRGAPVLDSAIMIRTADIDAAGRVRISVGATVVRHSDPRSEAAETRAKAAGLLAAFDDHRPVPLAGHPAVRATLADRNTGLSGFWLRGGDTPDVFGLTGRRVLVVDAEDTFTAMIAHQLRAMGLAVTVRGFADEYVAEDYELVVMGPGPGDPADRSHPRIAALYETVDRLLRDRHPFLAVCLSHQVLCGLLGLPVRRCSTSNQGRQRAVELFGDVELVGFYNSFAAHSDDDKIDFPDLGVVEISRDRETGEVHALRGQHFTSMQFHAESVLTENGPRILAARIREVLAA
ncbi:anthranilate synthase family protein [Actinophytocola gossypii]|uniref:anthranilate synthase n=1 Tax=Actinophytocola gossypii TaxID=2812003 RepID=A0ABT2J2P9_9PSEU|nr:anthranilate synthase family protein [Actinophytocola gossypii]MCT2581951.1 chorismate-binding protein [Actinophytocola gossypii]